MRLLSPVASLPLQVLHLDEFLFLLLLDELVASDGRRIRSLTEINNLVEAYLKVLGGHIISGRLLLVQHQVAQVAILVVTER